MTEKATSRREPPSVELYMYSLNQEFPAGKGHETYLKRHSELQQDVAGGLALRATVESQVFTSDSGVAQARPSDWSWKWLSNTWIQNHTKAAGNGLLSKAEDPMRSAILRREEFGAILFEPQSDRVYKLNASGADLFEQLRSQVTSGRISADRARGFTRDEVTAFVSALRAAGLWTVS